MFKEAWSKTWLRFVIYFGVKIEIEEDDEERNNRSQIVEANMH